MNEDDIRNEEELTTWSVLKALDDRFGDNVARKAKAQLENRPLENERENNKPLAIVVFQ